MKFVVPLFDWFDLQEKEPQKKKGLGLGLLKAKQPAGKMIQVPDRDQAQVSCMHLGRGWGGEVWFGGGG